MKDGVGKTIGKVILAVIAGGGVGLLLKIVLALLFAWLMTMGMLKFLVIGNIIAIPLAYIVGGAIIFLAMLFENRVASGIFGTLCALNIIALIIGVWCIDGEFTDKEWFKAFNITIVMGITAIVSLVTSWQGIDK
jgi:hypothetical protein